MYRLNVIGIFVVMVDVFLTFYQVPNSHFDILTAQYFQSKLFEVNRLIHDEPNIFGSFAISEAVRSEYAVKAATEQKAYLQKNRRKWPKIRQSYIL